MKKEKQDERLVSIKTMEAFTGTHIDVKELVDSWILLTYDIPHSKEGDRARSEFLRKARSIGATPHTESVYLLPWTPRGELLALDVAKVGNAFLWISNVADVVKATELTIKYDADVQANLAVVRDRIKRINKHLEEGKEGIASRMIVKTNKMLKDAIDIATRRGSADLCDKVNTLIEELNTLRFSKIPTKPKKHVIYDPESLKFTAG